MFADSISDPRLDHGSRRWTTLVSFFLQAVAVAALLTLPFLSTQGLPELSFVSHLMVPMSPAITPERSTHQQSNGAASSAILHISATPNYHPIGLPAPDEGTNAPPQLPFGSNTTGDNHFQGIESGTGTAVPTLVATPVAPPRVSVMMEGNLIHRVQPVYPPIARQARVSGTVVLQAVISREGSIENLQVVSGHPMLVRAAIDAVRQWRYRPYILNGDPLEVDTQVTVNFVLDGR
jgi:protein TonB